MLLDQARREFQVSRVYKENEPAVTRGVQVDRMIAQERLAQAKGLEADGLYFAARNEYRLVLLIEEENAEAKAGLDRMDREVRVSRSISNADMEMRRGDFDGAQAALEENASLTEAQVDDVSRMQAALEDARLEEMYLKARNLATDYRYPEAVAAYEELLAVAPDYQDAQAQKTTPTVPIARALRSRSSLARRASSAAFRSLMSCDTPSTPTAAPDASRMLVTRASIHTLDPSLR